MSREIFSYRICKKKKTRQKRATFSAANIPIMSYSFIVKENSYIQCIGYSFLNIYMKTKYF